MLPPIIADASSALSASGPVTTSPCSMAGIYVSAASASPTIRITDGTGGAGVEIVKTFVPVAGKFYPFQAICRYTGCYIEIGGTVSCIVFTNTPLPAGAVG